MGKLILILGGSGSGKSAYAETLLLSQCRGRAIYLATMEHSGEGSEERIRRHLAMRTRHGEEAGHLFHTVEQSTSVGSAPIFAGDYVLLEDVGNLLANEIWSPDGAGADHAVDAVVDGILSLTEKAELVVAVSNSIGSDGGQYPEGVLSHIRAIGEVNCALAENAEQVVEVVCGIPCPLKLSSAPQKIS